MTIGRNKGPAERAAATTPLDHRLVQELLKYGKKRFGTAWAPLETYVTGRGGNPDHLQFFVPWIVYHYRFQGAPAVSWYLTERGTSLPQTDRSWLEAQERAWISLWEVADVTPGVSIGLTDTLTGEQRLVYEVLGSKTITARLVILGRVVDYDGVSVIAGLHPQALPPREGARVVEFVRKQLRARKPVKPERLRTNLSEALLIGVWETAVEDLDQEERTVPRLQNTDGDELVPTIDRFTILPGKAIEMRTKLLALPGAEGHGAGISFVRAGNKMHRSWDNTIVGNAEIQGDTLKLETNSVKRADALRKKVEKACAGSIKHQLREHTNLEKLLTERAKEPRQEAEPGAEQLEAMREIKEQHYANWIDVPLPALKGKTPRQAMKVPKLRKELVLLLKDMENRESQLPEAERYDFGRIRLKLGLDEKHREQRR